MCRHYGWRHNFWRRMGRREFWTWVEQANRERDGEQSDPHSWAQADNDPGWAAMRQRRDELMGRRRAR